MAFVFGLQTTLLFIDLLVKYIHWVWSPKKDQKNFYVRCDLTKKYIYVHLQALAYFLGFIPVTTNSLPPSDMIKVY